jgi:hypothetical protein
VATKGRLWPSFFHCAKLEATGGVWMTHTGILCFCD